MLKNQQPMKLKLNELDIIMHRLTEDTCLFEALFLDQEDEKPWGYLTAGATEWECKHLRKLIMDSREGRFWYLPPASSLSKEQVALIVDCIDGSTLGGLWASEETVSDRTFRYRMDRGYELAEKIQEWAQFHYPGLEVRFPG